MSAAVQQNFNADPQIINEMQDPHASIILPAPKLLHLKYTPDPYQQFLTPYIRSAAPLQLPTRSLFGRTNRIASLCQLINNKARR